MRTAITIAAKAIEILVIALTVTAMLKMFEYLEAAKSITT